MEVDPHHGASRGRQEICDILGRLFDTFKRFIFNSLMLRRSENCSGEHFKVKDLL